MADPILTLLKVVVVMKGGEKAVYAPAQKGQTAAIKVPNPWRFEYVHIDRWIENQNEADIGCVGKGA